MKIVDEFAKLYYANPKRTWGDTYWRGVKTLKNPLDLWIYQEIINKVKPNIIIETGTGRGGSALFLADILSLNGEGIVRTVDIKAELEIPINSRISYFIGSSIDKKVVKRITEDLDGAKVLIILDSDHHKKHVLREMNIYSKFVTKDSYLIVEDTQMNGHPVPWTKGEGPMEAIEEFLASNSSFKIDTYWEKFYLTFNPRGFLRRC